MARNAIPVTIAVGATVSSVANGKGGTLVGVYIPANFSGTTLKFSAYPSTNQPGAPTGPSPISDGAGGDYTKTVRAGDYLDLSADLVTNGVDQISFTSGTTQATTTATLLAVFR